MFKGGLIHDSDFFLLDHSLCVDDDGRGDESAGLVISDNTVCCHRDGIIDLILIHKVADFIGAFVYGYPKNDGTVVFIFLIELDKIRNFMAAWPTPGGPKIDENDLSFEV